MPAQLIFNDQAWAELYNGTMNGPCQFQVVRDNESADPNSVRVTLFRCDTGVCAWYLCPLTAATISETYLSRSANMIASRAILRAADLADRIDVAVWIVDPDNLWSEAWGEARRG